MNSPCCRYWDFMLQQREKASGGRPKAKPPLRDNHLHVRFYCIMESSAESGWKARLIPLQTHDQALRGCCDEEIFWWENVHKKELKSCRHCSVTIIVTSLVWNVVHLSKRLSLYDLISSHWKLMKWRGSLSSCKMEFAENKKTLEMFAWDSCRACFSASLCLFL